MGAPSGAGISRGHDRRRLRQVEPADLLDARVAQQLDDGVVALDQRRPRVLGVAEHRDRRDRDQAREVRLELRHQLADELGRGRLLRGRKWAHRGHGASRARVAILLASHPFAQTTTGPLLRAGPSSSPCVRPYWIVFGPTTVLPTACTGPVSGGGTLPVLPVIVSEPVTLFELNSTPPVLPVIVTGPVSLLPAHGPVAASPPISTSPVVPVTVSGPEKFEPHMTERRRSRRAQRAGDRAALDVERTARLHRDRPGDRGAGADADRLARRDRQRSRPGPGDARLRVADRERAGDERAEAVVRRGERPLRAGDRVVAARR